MQIVINIIIMAVVRNSEVGTTVALMNV